MYVYVDSPSQARRKVRDSTYALRTSKNIRFEFEIIFECRKIRKTLKFSNFESNIFSNPTPALYCSGEKLNQHSALVERALLIFNFTP
jgi:hypothetical protein